MKNKINAAIRALEALAIEADCPMAVLEALLTLRKAERAELLKPRTTAKGCTVLTPFPIRTIKAQVA